MIYPRKRMAEKLKEGAPSGTVFQCSDSGWVNTELFIQWFKFFLNVIPPARPVLLLLDGHASHVSIDVIEVAHANDVHMLCLPAHTTHLLQPLDVGVFKSLKAHYYKACKQYIVANPGRVVTSEVIASLLAVAWPQSITPVNIMGGFKKSGVYPLNPGAITDRELAPSKAMKPKTSSTWSPGSNDTQATDESRFQTRYEEGYDLYDEQYLTWLRHHHPESVSAYLESSKSDSTSCSISAGTYVSIIDKAVVCNYLTNVLFCSGVSEGSSKSVASGTSSDLSELLALPKPRLQKKKRVAVNSEAKCITDDDVLLELKTKAREKEEKDKEKERRREERKLNKEAKLKEKAALKKKPQKTRRKSQRKTVVEKLQDLSLSDSEAECPECGLLYGEDDSLWIQCDACGAWWDVNCAGVSDIPDSFVCRKCK